MHECLPVGINLWSRAGKSLKKSHFVIFKQREDGEDVMIMGKRLIGLIIILSTFFTYIIYSKVKPASLLLEQRIG